ALSLQLPAPAARAEAEYFRQRISMFTMARHDKVTLHDSHQERYALPEPNKLSAADSSRQEIRNGQSDSLHHFHIVGHVSPEAPSASGNDVNAVTSWT